MTPAGRVLAGVGFSTIQNMCRNIRPLFNYDPPATKEEIHDASVQFVRKISGFQKPSHLNEDAFNHAVEETSKMITKLLGSLETTAEPHNREIEAERAKARAAKRFGTA